MRPPHSRQRLFSQAPWQPGGPIVTLDWAGSSVGSSIHHPRRESLPGNHMKDEVNGELVPVGGGDTIPLLRPVMVLGRRESCDVPLNFPNISGIHCELSFRDGYWSIKDLNSTNGVKVNGMRIQSRPLKPGDEIAIAKRRF